jgi:hypothetical protein
MEGWRARLPVIVVAIVVLLSLAVTFALPDISKPIYQAEMAKFASPQDVRSARRYVEMFRTRNVSALEAEIDSAEKQNIDSALIIKVAAMLGSREPSQVELVGFHTFTANSENYSDVVFQLRYPKSWIVAEVAFKRSGNDTRLEGIHLQPLPEPLEQINAFAFGHKGVTQYVALLLAAIVTLFTIITLFVCAAAPALPRKWLWLLGIIVGVCQMSVNWTTGSLAVEPVSVSFPPVRVVSGGPYSPWILYIAVPLGAICFWIVRFKNTTGNRDIARNTSVAMEPGQP